MPPVGKSGPGTISISSSMETSGLSITRDQGVADLDQVVRRDRRGHADRDALRAVDQQVRELRRQHRRLRALLVVGGQEIDRVHLHVVQHQRGDGRHAGLGIPHGRGGQPGDRAEVALLVDERIARVPLLGQADQRGIDGHVAVRMVALHRLADDARALRRGGARREAQVVHGDQNAALRGLQTVANVGQRAADDDAHRVGQVAVLQLFVDRQRNDPPMMNIATRIGGFLRRAIFGIGRFRRQICVGRQRASFRRLCVRGTGSRRFRQAKS